jgi:hypothetical protein
VTLGASALVIARWGPATMLRSRLRFAFAVLGAFFAARAISGALDSPALILLTLLIACVNPLPALLLAEGILRRHAPIALKAFVTLGGLVTAIDLIVDNGRIPSSTWVLGTFVCVSLAAVTALLVFRDRSSLSRQENAGLDALAVPGVVVTLLTVTDFLAQRPVGLSGVGVAMVAFVLGANPSSSRETRGVLADLALMAIFAAVAALVFAGALGLHTAFEQIRLGAALFAFLLATTALLRLRQAGVDGTAAGFARALTLADTSSLETFLDALADQPVLAGLRIADGAQLAEYNPETLGAALSTHPVWTPAMLHDGETTMTRALEELGDLMARNEATHAVMISREPLVIALLTLPGSGQFELVETNLALFGKLAAIAAGDRVCA